MDLAELQFMKTNKLTNGSVEVEVRVKSEKAADPRDGRETVLMQSSTASAPVVMEETDVAAVAGRLFGEAVAGWVPADLAPGAPDGVTVGKREGETVGKREGETARELHCPICGAPEIYAETPRTVYACGSSDYDGRPGTFRWAEKCGPAAGSREPDTAFSLLVETDAALRAALSRLGRWSGAVVSADLARRTSAFLKGQEVEVRADEAGTRAGRPCHGAELVLALDIETSGLDPWRHGALSVGAVAIVKGVRVGEFSCEVRLPEWRAFNPEVTAINGYTEEVARSRAPRGRGVTVPVYEPEEALSMLGRWMWSLVPEAGKKWMLVGQNVAKHDLWFLDGMGQLPGGAGPGPALAEFWRQVQHRTLDLHAMCVALELAEVLEAPGDAGWNSRAVWAMAGLGEEGLPHLALDGAQRTARAWLAVVARCRGVEVSEVCRCPAPVWATAEPGRCTGCGLVLLAGQVGGS